jgi:hypothetical protein
LNSPEKARLWTEFLATREEITGSERLLMQFNAGTISRICDCGCNSYDIQVPIDSGLEPLLPSKERGGCAFSVAFSLGNRTGSIEFDVFVNAGGYLAGIDVSCNGNSEPVPEKPQLAEPPYHVNGPLMRGSDSV